MTAHPSFKAEVEGEYKHRLALCEEEQEGHPLPEMKLLILKASIRATAKYIKYLSDKDIAQTTAHRLSCTLTLIRAIETDHFEVAE